MNKKDQAIKSIRLQRLLPLFYHPEKEVCLEVVQTLYKAGVRVIEFTNRGESALDNFISIKKLADVSMPGLLLGAGTIKSIGDAEIFIGAGADFIICPVVNELVGKKVQKANLLWIPGCMTPTEISIAENCGANIVKIFPGNILGPSYLTAIREIFPNVEFIPTGGVELNEKNLRAWFDAGVIAVGLGSKLISRTVLEEHAYDELFENSQRAVKIISSMNPG